MSTPRYLFTTYTSVTDALTTIDAWLVSTMGYTRNLGPTTDTVSFTGQKAHYQYTFLSGETICLNFHTDTVNNLLYLTCSTMYSVSLAWNAQTATATVLSGALIYSKIVVPVTTTNNALYLFGDASGNCQIFVQRGSTLAVSDLMHWGLLNKSGFGAWLGGQYFYARSLNSTTLSNSNVGAGLWIGSGSSSTPTGAIYISIDAKTNWAAIKSFSEGALGSSEPSATIGKTSAYWSSIIVGSNFSSAYSPGEIPTYENDYSELNYITPSVNAVIVEDLPGGYVNGISGKIHMSDPFTIYARHEAAQAISPIGRTPFGYHCPIAGYYQFVPSGTQFVQDGRTFMLIGNVAAEMVSV